MQRAANALGIFAATRLPTRLLPRKLLKASSDVKHLLGHTSSCALAAPQVVENKEASKALV